MAGVDAILKATIQVLLHTLSAMLGCSSWETGYARAKKPDLRSEGFAARYVQIDSTELATITGAAARRMLGSVTSRLQ